MKKILFPAAVLLLALTGCASHGDKKPATQSTSTPAVATTHPTVNPDIKIDSQKALAYACGSNGDIKLTVMYGFSGDNVAAAQVELQGKATPVLLRVTNEANYNKFMSASPEGFVWATPVATKSTLESVDGLGLAQPSVQTIKGQQLIVPQVVTQNCKLDVQASAALARHAAETTAAPVKQVKQTKVTKVTKKVVKVKK